MGRDCLDSRGIMGRDNQDSRGIMGRDCLDYVDVLWKGIVWTLKEL